jgi:hypothetical protein
LAAQQMAEEQALAEEQIAQEQAAAVEVPEQF